MLVVQACEYRARDEFSWLRVHTLNEAVRLLPEWVVSRAAQGGSNQETSSQSHQSALKDGEADVFQLDTYKSNRVISQHITCPRL